MKVKVRILQTRHPLYKAGDEVELPEEKARFAVANRWAEIIEEKTATRKTATSKQAENRTTASTAPKSSKKSTSRRRKRKTNK